MFEFDFHRLAMMFVPFMMAVVFHEFAHGYAANRWGDTTAKDMGRMTLNPLPHIDPLGTVFLPLLMMATGVPLLLGWAKPVPINPTRFKKYRPGLFWVSFAGPLMNFLLAFVSAFAHFLVIYFIPRDFYLFEPLVGMTQVSVLLNYFLGIFNLFPLPPLDGSKMIQSFLSYHATQKYEAIGQYSFFIIIGLIWIGFFGKVLVPPTYFMTHLTLNFVGFFFGLIFGG